MKIDAAILSLRLNENGHLRLEDARGVSVRASSGVLWVTQAGEGVDYLLKPGAVLTLDRKGVTIICAMTDAELQIDNGSWRSATVMSRLLASVGRQQIRNVL